ncbi:MAG TPA: hypothetical protein VFT30_08100 [Nitrospira sp.]|jgi:hypothetical protein|nr:hypothetical protein [Nitrospira sp.]
MDENREKQLDIDIEDTTRAEMENEQIEQRERNESVEQVQTRAEKRTQAGASETQTPAASTNDELVPLFEDEAAQKFRSRWQVIQGKFVDDPRDSVKQADDLVADIIKSVTMSFADRRIGLEKQWNGGENISTEDMRLALKRYRSFFERLLTLDS